MLPVCGLAHPPLLPLLSNASVPAHAPRWPLLQRMMTPRLIRFWRVRAANGVPRSGTDAELDRPVKKREVVEHIMLLKAKPDLSEIEEKDMLDYLYTTQYQMRGILAVSLGRIEHHNIDHVTHALYMRFQRREDITKFYNHPYYVKVCEEYVMPNCYGIISAVYDSEVEDDIIHIFRRGEEYSCGVVWVLLLCVNENAPQNSIVDALSTLGKLILKFKSSIVQATQGRNFKLNDSKYTHASVVHFQSVRALETFRGTSEFKSFWTGKLQPISSKILSVEYTVDPIGTELM